MLRKFEKSDGVINKKNSCQILRTGIVTKIRGIVQCMGEIVGGSFRIFH